MKCGPSWPACLAALLLSGCGPSLQQPESFNPKRVRDIQYSDECGLQAYFDGKPPPIRQEGESSIANARGAAAGRATFRVEAGAPRKQLARLLERYYKDVPPELAAHQGLVIATVPFATTTAGGEAAWRQIPIGAELELEWDGHQTKLPYHPCLSSFFFGQSYYETRRRLLDLPAPATQP